LGEEQSKAFNSLKDYLANMIKMIAPDSKDTLLLYISASHSAVSAALMLEKEVEGSLRQVLVYFVSEALSGSKLFYSELEKIAYAIIISSRKLHHYFEAHKIVVVTNQPLHDVFSNREALSRITKWASELSEFYIDFKRRTAIKSQVLANFIADWTSQTFAEETPIEPWVIYCDGAWCKDGVGISAIVESPSGVKIRYAARLNFTMPDPSTNNTTQYEALLLGLHKMKALGHQNFAIKSDSKVITDHIEKESEAQGPDMVNYLEAVRAMEKHFNGFTVEHIPRAQNSEVDKVAKAAARKQPLP
jgi:ribonuclease HI